MLRLLQCLIIFSGIFFAGMTVAAQNNALTTVTVTVPDHSSASFQQGLQAAFSQLMIQLSNNPQIMSQANIQAVAKNAMQYVQSYQYEQQQTTTNLQIVFDSSMMQQLIQPTTTAVTQSETSTNSPNNSTEITVSNIQNMTDYANVLQTLRAKSDVAHVSASEINDNQVVFTITVSDNTDQFLQNLNSDANFQAKTAHHYTWAG